VVEIHETSLSLRVVNAPKQEDDDDDD